MSIPDPFATRQASCDGKKPYRTKRAVKAAIRRSRARGVTRLVPYRCRYCGFFHRGHRKAAA